MRGEVDSARLAELVVRIDRFDGKPGGTGFFVAPGWVLTCAHVVKGLDEVSLVPHAGGGPLSARVRARSAEPEPGRKLWPFPDLALLEFSEPFDHRCALLEDVDPGQAEDCVAWGYAGWEEGVVPQGSAARLRFLGRDGDGFLGLKDDVVRGGLSGSPLVCPQRRAVVGVVTATRDPAKNLGGWASPVGALKGGPDVPEELATLGRQVLADNRAAVLADRGAWHAVVPIEGANALLTHGWAEFRKGSRADPADLLLAEFGVVPYKFREGELREAEAWCLSDAPSELAVVSGIGGSGKNRFALELCKLMANRHSWIAGEMEDLRPSSVRRQFEQLPLPRIAFVDYAEGVSPKLVRELFEGLHAYSTPMAPARLVLLIRDRSTQYSSAAVVVNAVRQPASGSVKLLLSERRPDVSLTEALTLRQRTELYASAVQHYAGAWGINSPTTRPDLSREDYGSPLSVLFEALDNVLRAAPPTEDVEVDDDFWGSGLAQRVLAHEERYWSHGSPVEPRHVLRDCVALATLATAANSGEADDLLSWHSLLAGADNQSRRRDLGSWLHSLYRGHDFVNPLRPDRLGEALVAMTLLEPSNDGLLNRAILGSSDRQLSRILTVMMRCSARESRVERLLNVAVTEQHHFLVTRARSAAKEYGSSSSDDQLATIVISVFHSPVGETIEAAQYADIRSAHAAWFSFMELGYLARKIADEDHAREFFRRSHTIVQRGLRLFPHSRELQHAMWLSLTRLGESARTRRADTEAVEYLRSSLQVIEHMVAGEPSNGGYMRDMAATLGALGDVVRAIREFGEAERLLLRSLQTLRELVERDPDDLSLQLDSAVANERLGDLARDKGDVGKARRQYSKSIDKLRDLTRKSSEASSIHQDLALSLDRLATLERSVRNLGTARRLQQEAVSIREQIVSRRPDDRNSQRQLGDALRRLAELQVSGNDAHEAEQALLKARDVYEGLLIREPSNPSYRKETAQVLRLLSVLTAKRGDERASRFYEERAMQVSESLPSQEHGRATGPAPASASYRGPFPFGGERPAQVIQPDERSDSKLPGKGLRKSVVRRGSRSSDRLEAKSLYRQALSSSGRDPGHSSIWELGPGERDELPEHESLRHLLLTVDYRAARRYLKKALDEQYSGAEAALISADIMLDFAYQFEQLGDLNQKNGSAEEAIFSYQSAREILAGLLNLDPRLALPRVRLVSVLEKLAEVSLATKNRLEARRLYQLLLEETWMFELQDIEEVVYLRVASRAYTKLGDIAREIGIRPESVRLYTRAVQFFHRLELLVPSDTTVQLRLCSVMEKLGIVQYESGRWELALAELRNARERRAIMAGD